MEGKKRHQLEHSDDHDEEEMILRSPDYLKAKGRHLYLFMQADGNLVLYPNTDQIPATHIWASKTHGKGRSPHHLILQRDGNLVIFDADNWPTWSTNTHKVGKGCIFKVEDDGELVLYSYQGKQVWASQTRA